MQVWTYQSLSKNTLDAFFTVNTYVCWQIQGHHLFIVRVSFFDELFKEVYGKIMSETHYFSKNWKSHILSPLTWPKPMQIYWKPYKERGSTPTRLVWGRNMAAILLFWDTNMADVTSCKDGLWSLLIDLFSSYVLFSQLGPRDVLLLSICNFFNMQTYARGCTYIGRYFKETVLCGTIMWSKNGKIKHTS